MGRIIYRGAYATFPMVGIVPGDYAYATDYLILYEWSGAAWQPYYDYPDYEGAKQKLYTVADLAAAEATDMNLTAAAVNIAFTFGTMVIYLVPAGRTLYITQVSFASRANLIASGDLNQMCIAHLQNATTGILQHRQGGNGGGASIFNKPIVIPGGNTVNIYVNNYANHNCDLMIHAAGYLI